MRQSLVVIICVLIWFGAARTQEPRSAVDPYDPPKLTIELSKTQIVVRGDVSSAAHESILRQRANALFPQREQSYEFYERPALPPGWALISELTLRAISQTYASTATITPTEISISGIGKGTQNWHDGLLRVENNLLPGMRLMQHLTEIGSLGTLERQCNSLFRAVLRERKIEFPQSDARLKTSASPILDALIQIAADCASAHVRISGHTDNTGDESGNLALSNARADAVAAYMTAGGIRADRITARGVGSSEPFVGENTSRARQINRRIEIELVFTEN